MIQIYTGNGKGKTTAALGLALRACGHGLRIRVIQFMKGNTFSGELVPLEKLGIEIYQFGRTCPHAAVIKSGFMTCQECNQCWIIPPDITAWDRQKTGMAWKLARETLLYDNYDLVILDEIIIAVNNNLIPLHELSGWLHTINRRTEVVLTGRDAPRELLNMADLVTEMKLVKHPYETGMQARRGIEY